MAKNDIYHNKEFYESTIRRLKDYLSPPPKENLQRKGCRHYYIKNKENIDYFYKLDKKLESRDISYGRRKKLIGVLLFVCHHTTKNLKEIDREDIDKIMSEANKKYKTIESRTDIVKDLKVLWKALLPEKDEKGRYDETIAPYPVRHLSRKIDKSHEELRDELITLEEYEKLMDYFSKDNTLKLYFSLIIESLARPQEVSMLKIGRIHDDGSGAKIFVGERGKEGEHFTRIHK